MILAGGHAMLRSRPKARSLSARCGLSNASIRAQLSGMITPIGTSRFLFPWISQKALAAFVAATLIRSVLLERCLEK